MKITSSRRSVTHGWCTGYSGGNVIHSWRLFWSSPVREIQFILVVCKGYYGVHQFRAPRQFTPGVCTGRYEVTQSGHSVILEAGPFTMEFTPSGHSIHSCSLYRLLWSSPVQALNSLLVSLQVNMEFISSGYSSHSLSLYRLL